MRSYGSFAMSAPAQPSQTKMSEEADLRGALERGETQLRSVPLLLAHLLGNGSNSLFSDEIIASIRGMTDDISRQVLEAFADASSEATGGAAYQDTKQALADVLLQNHSVVSHLHALAIEWQLTQRLHNRLALDPVLSPLLQDLIASTNPEISGLAMHVLASQARFCQAQRRMKLAVNELPADMLFEIITTVRRCMGDESSERSGAVEAWLRSRCDESKSRIGLISRLFLSMGGQGTATLNVSNAGAALFVSALSMVSHQSRAMATLILNDGQVVRLTLALRAAGLKAHEVAAQIFTLHPDIHVPMDLELLSPDRAAAILATSPHAGTS
jgi:hypothetical protein